MALAPQEVFLDGGPHKPPLGETFWNLLDSFGGSKHLLNREVLLLELSLWQRYVTVMRRNYSRFVKRHQVLLPVGSTN